MTKTLLLDCGSGGRASQRLINELFLEQFDNPILRTLDDAAKLELSGPIAMSTDGYTVTPLFFPGGNIGTLAVHGTVNDVSMLGARPRYLTCGFILEEGLDLDLLRKVVESMAEAARSAGVLIVSGDTKVVPRGACDKLFITTAGVGEILADPSPSGSGARPGDAILVSGAVGDHGLAVLGQRDSLSFLQGVESDSAALNKMVERLMLEVGDIHVLRDPTRGGLATTLNEIAGQSGVVCSIEEASIPIHDAVRSGCDVLGLDPLYLANEGKMLCFVPEAKAQAALDVLRSEPQGREAARIGTVLEAVAPSRPGQVVLQTPIGGRRLLSMLEGDQLPRICSESEGTGNDVGRGEGTFLKKSFLLPSPHPSPHLPKTFVTGIRRGVVCRAGPDEETLMSAGAHELNAGDCCAASFPPELLSCSLPPSKFLLEGVQGRALFSKSVVPRFIRLHNERLHKRGSEGKAQRLLGRRFFPVERQPSLSVIKKTLLSSFANR